MALLDGAATVSEDALLADSDWLLPWLGNVRTAADLRGLDLAGALLARLGPAGRARLDRLAPPAFATPLGRLVPIDYDAETPSIAVRLQEMFGLAAHPVVAGRPLRIALTSPAGRPVAVTTDLPGFWAGGYAEVRRDLRGRYPRHPWPDDPAAAAPTVRAKPRGG